MKKIKRSKALVSGAVAVAMVASLFAAGLVLGAGDRPTIYVDGIELRTMTDGSVQALLELSVSSKDVNKNKIRALELPIQYNSEYMVPSDWKTNAPLVEKNINSSDPGTSDDNDPLYHLFFRTDEALYTVEVPVSGATDGSTEVQSADPFNWGRPDTSAGTNTGYASVQPNSERMDLHLVLRSDLVENLDKGGNIGKAPKAANSQELTYIQTGEEKTTIGTISFRVDPDKLPELMAKFNGTNGIAADLTLLIREHETEEWHLSYLEQKVGRPPIGYTLQLVRGNKNNANLDISINLIDAVLNVEPIEDDLTINAYQAFTDGKVSDLARVMQNYADSVRVTYASGAMEDTSIYWGDGTTDAYDMPNDGPGMLIDCGRYTLDGDIYVRHSDGQSRYRGVEDPAGDYIYNEDTDQYEKYDPAMGAVTRYNMVEANGYRFTWNADGGYTFEKWMADDTGTFAFVPGVESLGNDGRYSYTFTVSGSEGAADIEEQFIYEPKAGRYTISQYFTYLETVGIPSSGSNEEQLKTYPYPVEIQLNVTRVELVDVVVDRPALTFWNEIGEVPYRYSGLQLVEEAKLELNATPDFVVGGVPVVTPISGVIPTMSVGWTPNLIEDVKTTAQDGTELHWPLEDDDVTNRVGVDAATGIGEYEFESNLTRGDIQRTYPWLTVPKSDYPLESKRTLIDETEWPWDDSWPDAEAFEMRAYPSDEDGYLTIEVAKRKKNEDGTYSDHEYESMQDKEYDGHRLYQSDGTYIDPAWFTAGNSGYNGRYNVGLTWAGNMNGYQITINPGDLNATDAYAAQREALRRNINLGGWFSMEVLKNTVSKTDSSVTLNMVSDPISAYSRPRMNVYLRSYILEPGTTGTALEAELFDFTGLRAGLLPVYPGAGLSTLVTLPATKDKAADWVVTRYDAVSGEEPGYTRQFKVDPAGGTQDQWPTITGTMAAGQIVDFGADLFARTYTYSGYGTVQNPTGSSAYINRQAKVRVQLQSEEEKPDIDPADLRLTYEQFGDSIRYTADNQVQRVLFNTKQEGYTYQQVVTLTLTNLGTDEIKGIYILPSESYFTILSQPAANLAAGASTTFEISYVPNLLASPDNTGLDSHFYEDVKLDVMCSQGWLKTFEAEITITKKPVYEVTLIVRPEDLSMGTAGFVAGVTTVAGTDTYDSTSVSGAYTEDSPVWILTTRKDEYELLELNGKPQVYYYINNVNTGNEADKVYLEEYIPTADGVLSEDERLFRFPTGMPDYSVTVYVDYFEPLLSKLRLSDLHAFAWQMNDGSNVWDSNSERDLRETDSGMYQVVLFDSQRDEYVVLLNDDDDFCGVEVTLRELLAFNDALGINEDVYPWVTMNRNDANNTSVYSNEPSTENPNGTPGDTAVPTQHRSMIFAAPEAGETAVITVRIFYDKRSPKANGINKDQWPIDFTTPDSDGKDVVVERIYKVRFAKRPTDEALHVAMAGNSPYGMIENDDVQFPTPADKMEAKRAFDLSSRFQTSYTPVKAEGLTNIYWPEAWEDGINYDKDDIVLFVYLGQAFDDPGAKEIKTSAGDLLNGTIDISLNNYYQLDDAAGTLSDKFNSDTMITAPLSLKTDIPVVDGVMPVSLVDAFADVKTVRPGIYRLTYTFVDHIDQEGGEEHTMYFTRPVIILSPKGDVDANIETTSNVYVTATDADAVRDRYSASLPLEATNYPQADQLLYRYRILDANNDRNINNIDSNLIRRSIATGVSLTEFYRPVDYMNHVDNGGDNTP